MLARGAGWNKPRVCVGQKKSPAKVRDFAGPRGKKKYTRLTQLALLKLALLKLVTGVRLRLHASYRLHGNCRSMRRGWNLMSPMIRKMKRSSYHGSALPMD